MKQSIDRLAYRYKEPITHLLPEHYHPCDRNMFFQLRNVMHIKYDARIESFRKACELEMLNWMKALGYKINKKDEFTVSKIEDEVVLLVIDYVNFKSVVHIHDLLRKTSTVSNSGHSLNKCLHIKVDRDFNFEIENIVYDQSVLDKFNKRVIEIDSLPPKNETHCNECAYIDFCTENALANANCRTCSSIESDFTCKHGKTLCNKHSYHPDFVKLIGFDFVSADPDTMTIDYGKFSNGQEGSMTSETMQKAYGLQFLQNEAVQEVLDVFDGKLENVKRLSK